MLGSQNSELKNNMIRISESNAEQKVLMSSKSCEHRGTQFARGLYAMNGQVWHQHKTCTENSTYIPKRRVLVCGTSDTALYVTDAEAAAEEKQRHTR